jgi:hypothetical protein
MKNPVLSLTTGITYERSAIAAWRSDRGDVCPVSGHSLGFLVPNETLKAEINDWKQQIKGFRRIQRGSPTTYFVANNSEKTQPPSPHRGKKKSDNMSAELEQHLAQAKDEMFDMAEKMMQTFTDAGISDYIKRTMYDGEKGASRTTPPSTLPDLNALIEDATTSGYRYNVEYNSIFRHGPTIGHPRSV